jgi:hypothetical protein
MRLPVVRWLVLFFTRPIRLSDFAPSRRRPDPREADDVEAAAARRERLATPRPVAPGAGSERVSRLPARAASVEIEVSEQPLDTLPAELQEELLHEQARNGVVASPKPVDGSPAPGGE